VEATVTEQCGMPELTLKPDAGQLISSFLLFFYFLFSSNVILTIIFCSMGSESVNNYYYLFV